MPGAGPSRGSRGLRNAKEMRTQEGGTFPERHVSDLNIFVAKAMVAV